MLQIVEASEDATFIGEADENARMEDDSGKQKRGRALISISIGTTKKSQKNDEMELEDLEWEKEARIQLRDYVIETLTTICDEMEEKVAKSTRK